MTYRLVLLPLFCGWALASCADFAATAARVSPALTAACDEAMAIAGIALFVPGAGGITPFITAGCATAEGVAKLAADPASTQWVGTLIGQVKELAGNVGLKL